MFATPCGLRIVLIYSDFTPQRSVIVDCIHSLPRHAVSIIEMHPMFLPV